METNASGVTKLGVAWPAGVIGSGPWGARVYASAKGISTVILDRYCISSNAGEIQVAGGEVLKEKQLGFAGVRIDQPQIEDILQIFQALKKMQEMIVEENLSAEIAEERVKETLHDKGVGGGGGFHV